MLCFGANEKTRSGRCVLASQHFFRVPSKSKSAHSPDNVPTQNAWLRPSSVGGKELLACCPLLESGYCAGIAFQKRQSLGERPGADIVTVLFKVTLLNFFIAFVISLNY